MLRFGQRDAGDRMLLNFTTVANAVASLNSLQEAKGVVHKIVHFQSRGFPLPRAGNRRRKPMLDTNDTMRLVIACELVACGIATARTIRMVDGAWAPISSAIARAARSVATRGDRATEVIAFAPEVMHDTADDDGQLYELVDPDLKRRPHRLLTIDVAQTVRGLSASLELQGVATAEEVLHELGQLGVVSAEAIAAEEPCE